VLRLLLIDDDSAVVSRQVRQAFSPPAYSVEVVDTGSEGVERIRRSPPDVVLLDLRLPDGSGLDFFERIRVIDARIPVVFITMTKNADMAIEAMKKGAFDYLFKPLELQRLRDVVSAAATVVHLRAPVALANEAEGIDTGSALCGACPAMLDVYKAIGRVAAQDVTVLVTGESGTGKEVVARAIYQHSTRSKAPFVALNCAAIPEALLESELFGHERGAFTGADRRRIGKFEQYSGGTILLDEIGDMPLALQAKALRLLQEQTFERVGGSESVKTDVRLIASTHRDLQARAADERFRADLFYRLSVFTIHLPPLRERRDDLVVLVNHYLRRFNRELGRNVREIAPAALDRLKTHHWPGNVRELQSVLKKALLHASGDVLLPAFLPELGPGDETPKKLQETAAAFDLDAFIRNQLSSASPHIHGEIHAEVDRLLYTRALEHTRGNQRDAARLLGISRQTMRIRLRALGLHVTRAVEPDDDDP
jgi:two-component system nitrogen regulation response regulator GlnG